MGNNSLPINENSYPKPISPYGASKLSCESYINAYSSMYEIESYILRFGNVYGPYCFHKKGVVNKLLECTLQKKIFNIFGDGTSSRDYIYVKDTSLGMENSFFNGCKQTQATTIDGGPAFETFVTNPNTLKVSDSGRGSGEPILDVE